MQVSLESMATESKSEGHVLPANQRSDLEDLPFYSDSGSGKE